MYGDATVLRVILHLFGFQDRKSLQCLLHLKSTFPKDYDMGFIAAADSTLFPALARRGRKERCRLESVWRHGGVFQHSPPAGGNADGSSMPWDTVLDLHGSLDVCEDYSA